MALIKCPECGREVSDKAASCPQCGYPISKLASGTAASTQVSPRQAPVSSLQSGRPVCPLCGNDYNITKVSATHSSQTSTYGGISSELARNLRPPAKPNYDLLEWFFVILAVIAMLVMGAKAGWSGSGGITDWAVFFGIIGLGLTLKKTLDDRAKPRYTSQLRRWEAIYYCQRHDIVFIPGEARSYPPDQTYHLFGD